MGRHPRRPDRSLCEGWRVRDVVAHVMNFDGVSLLGMLRRAIRARFVHINQVLTNSQPY